MKNKLSKNIVDTYNPEKITRYSIRKASFGATSVAVAAFFMYLGQGTAAASDTNIQDQVNQITSIDENKNNITENTEEKTSKETVVKSETNTLDKTKLSSLIAEIESKIVSGAYDSKTEDSVSKLKVELGTVKTILESAKTQEELARAYNKLVTATTQLKTKPEEKKEAPAVDTTNGQPTVGKKATNTEKSTESNSIANSGSKDERNGKALNTNNPFRTDAATTDIDPAANQTYTAPAADADLNTLVKTLLALDPTVENNTRLSQNMDSLGDSKEVAKGAVKEINEFGGWTAVDGGVFAIARRTEEGVYPLETINSTLDDTVWLQEQAFDRDTEYTLLLSKSRTRSNRDEVVYDNSTYKPTGEGGGITKNLVRYKGIEKTFTAYSTKEGSDVIVKFKPGYVGDSEGSKANYKVQVYSITGNQESLVYETTFDPSRNINDGKQIVTAAKDGTNKAKIKISGAGKGGVRFDPNTGVDNTERPNFIGKREAEKLMAQPGNKPNGTAGTFTSKPIALPKGADHYKVRISLADQNRTGMSYQAWDDKYSVPVTGDDFSIAQDTSNVARNLLQRIYDKLKATESADKNGKTSQTIQDYEAELEKVKTLLANPAARTPNFKQALQDLLAKQLGLKTDKTGLTNSKAELDALVNEDPTPGKTTDTAKAYNVAKEAAKTEIAAALTVINDENATPEQVSVALEKVNAKKTALQQAKDGLIVAATAEEKAKLKADADLLTKADETGKTPDSIAAYERKYEELKAQLEAAKTEAAAVLAKGNNATKEEVKAAQAKVDAVKTELENAKNLLVEAATTEEKNKLKADADSLVKVDTTGKTADSIKAYESEFEKLKAQLEAAKTEAAAVLAKGNNATKAEVQAAQAKVDAAKTALDKAAESLKDLDREVAKKEIADAAKKATDAIEASASLTPEQKVEEKAKVAKEAKDAIDAIDKATTEEGINSAKENGKLAIEKEAAITAIKAEKAAKEQEIDNNTKLSDEEKAPAKAEVAKAATESVEAITKADTKDAVEAAKIKGEAAIKAVNPIGKAKALDAIQKAAEEKIVEIDKNDKLSAEEKAEAKAEVAKAAIKAVTAIQEAKDQATVNTAEETGVKAIKAVTPVGKAKALDAIQKAAEEKIAEIDKNDKLSAEEKAKAKAEVAKAATEAVEAIQKAETQDAVDAAQAKGETAIKAVTPVGKVKALDAIQKAAEEKIAEIDKNDKLSAEAKAEAKAEVAKAATEAVEAIQKAETQDAVDAAQAKGETAIKAVNPIGKALNGQSTNKDALTKATTTEAEAIKGSPAYYNADETKKAAYDKALEEAKKVLAKANATQAEVDAALKALEEAKAALNGQPTNKDALTKATTTEAEATKGSPAYYNADEAKKAAYDKALEEAKKVLVKVNATQAEVDAALKALEEARAALNGQPTNKDALTKAVTTEAEETKGSPAYYNADETKKAAYDKALEEAKKVLAKANATQEEVDAALKALEEAKAALNGQPTNKDALTKATTTEAEETKGSPAYYNADEAKKAAYNKALEEAKKVLAKANATQAEVDAALKTLEEARAALNGVETYKINPTINEVEEFDLSKLLVKGIVVVKKGQDLTEKDIRSKLNLPDGVDIVEIEYPNTNTLGKKVAKVTFRGNDGNLFTIEVPIEVVENTTNTDETNNNRYSEGRVLVNKNTEQTNKEGLKASKNTLPNTGTTETNTGLAGLGLGILGALLAATKRRKEK